MRYIYIIAIFIGFIFLIQSCRKNDEPTPDTGIEPNAPYAFILPNYFPALPVPADNPLTVRGVELGRMLFYDPILSSDSTISCASCHNITHSFADNKAFSTGVNNATGIINAMALINLGWQERFFWNGRSHSLENQALEPINNPIEMHETSENVVKKLKRHPIYSKKFQAAFGIENITPNLVAKAIAQFERIIVSYQSKYDKFYEIREEAFNAQEFAGLQIFFSERGQCFHCHGANGTILAHNLDTVFRNNGLLSDAEQVGRGLGGITGNRFDDGKFKVPTLRNIELTAPYMHDGRFNTLEEVVDFYSSSIHLNQNIDINFSKIGDRIDTYGGLGLSSEEKANLVTFLKTLTDTTFVKNPLYQDPFK